MAKVFLSAGHGGSDPGAVGNGLKEKDINLQIMLAEKEVLERHGVTVVCSRLKDENDPVTEEVREANDSGACVAHSVHTNAGKGDGSESLYYPGSYDGKRLGGLFEKYVKELGQNSRGVKARGDLWFLRGTKMVAVITECAFIDNVKDISIVDTVAEQRAFGVAYAKAILEYLGITYKVPSTTKPEIGKTEVKVDYAKSFDKTYARTYTVSSKDGLNMRAGANTSKQLIVNVPNGAKVQCYGYYTKESDGTVWLLVSYNGYTGFMSKGYLK